MFVCAPKTKYQYICIPFLYLYGFVCTNVYIVYMYTCIYETTVVREARRLESRGLAIPPWKWASSLPVCSGKLFSCRMCVSEYDPVLFLPMCVTESEPASPLPVCMLESEPAHLRRVWQSVPALPCMTKSVLVLGGFEVFSFNEVSLLVSWCRFYLLSHIRLPSSR